MAVIDSGILKGLLMTRAPRKELSHSNGHARATRFGGPRAMVGNLIVWGKPNAPRAALSRSALLAEMTKAAAVACEQVRNSNAYFAAPGDYPVPSYWSNEAEGAMTSGIAGH